MPVQVLYEEKYCYDQMVSVSTVYQMDSLQTAAINTWKHTISSL
ncbi:hypothetical protein PSEHALCIP103_03708 [Pseudoalteromonas haloplanktis]|uniref:Uncharacterized protein n=1 Tax=Pseudoalteromonas haloplanktis TaxID=228 RepID=A0A9W4R575_PSEHA|nr:hypothetical protein PSEHALCIP103_03708 [Pseudoalteromonas haloplanktis]